MENREKYNRSKRSYRAPISTSRVHFLAPFSRLTPRPFAQVGCSAFFSSPHLTPGRISSLSSFPFPALFSVPLPRFTVVPLRTAYKICTTSPRLRHRLARQIGFPKKWPRGLFSPVSLFLSFSLCLSLSAHFPLRISECINIALKSAGHARPARRTTVASFGQSDLPSLSVSSLFNYRSSV